MSSTFPTDGTSPAPACTVVVTTLHRPRLLARCLDAIAELEHDDFELVVVDNSAGDPETKAVAEAAGARVVTETRRGVSHARNAGAAAARGSIVAFTDDDAIPHPRWLSGHCDALASDPSLSATTGRILPLPEALQQAAADEDEGNEDLGPLAFRVDRSDPEWFERTNFGGVGVGPNMAFRRECFAGGWGFHPALGPPDGIPGEEHFAWYQVVRAGRAIAYLPDAVVHHPGLLYRSAKIMRGSAAYALMLLVEDPPARRRVLRYARAAVSGRQERWRPGRTAPTPTGRSERLRAVAAAPADYLSWRRRFGGVRAPVDP